LLARLFHRPPALWNRRQRTAIEQHKERFKAKLQHSYDCYAQAQEHAAQEHACAQGGNWMTPRNRGGGDGGGSSRGDSESESGLGVFSTIPHDYPLQSGFA